MPQPPPPAIGLDQLLALDAVARLCHVQWLPFTLARVEDWMDQAFGVLRAQVVDCPAFSVPREEDAAAQFYQMRKAMALPDDTPFEGIVGLFVQLANAAQLLRLLENAANRLRQTDSDETTSALLAAIQTARSAQSAQSPAKGLGIAESVEQSLRGRLNERTMEVAWRVPLFAKAAQMLSQDDLFCEKLPLFADRFVVTLFGKLEEWEKANVESVMGTVVSVLTFLLIVTRCELQFFDGGECMKVGEEGEMQRSLWRIARRRR